MQSFEKQKQVEGHRSNRKLKKRKNIIYRKNITKRKREKEVEKQQFE